MIKQIKIETETENCRIEGDKLLQYLPKRRLGIFSNTLEIKVKNCSQ